MGITAIPELDKEIVNFQDLTHQLSNYNEIYNLNLYLQNQATDELNRLQATNESLKSQVLKMKQEYLSMDYHKNLNMLKSNIMIMSMLAFAIMFIIVGLHLKGTIPRNIMFIALGVAVVLYLVAVLAMVMSNNRRRRSNWTQFYWESLEKQK